MSRKKSSPKREIIKLGVTIAIIVAVILGGNFALQLALGTPIPIVVVTSGSMRPTLNVGDVCVIQRLSPDQYVVGDHINRTGDIIVYDATGIYSGSEPVIHRIIDRIYNGTTGHYWFLTQGDNNYAPDPAWVEDVRVYGKVILMVPWIGNIFLFLRGGGVWLVVLALAIVIVLMFYGEVSKIDKKMKEKLESEPSDRARVL